jgi:hypothetical protein
MIESSRKRGSRDFQPVEIGDKKMLRYKSYRIRQIALVGENKGMEVISPSGGRSIHKGYHKIV